MVAWNGNFPNVLGNEALFTRAEQAQVWSGSPARWLRLPSTTAETITALKLSATVDPLSRFPIPTVIDICAAGNEFTDIPKLVRLLPNSDNLNTGWTDQAGGTTSLFATIDEDSSQWPGPAGDAVWMQTILSGAAYAHGVNAALFNTGGAAANGRIFSVSVGAILAANTGFRQMECKLMIDGAFYAPAGGSVRETHGFGKKYEFLWGEINPATNLPWTPSDIAQFDVQTDWGVWYRSHGPANATQWPILVASSLNVRYLETENRVAVGVWRRPADIGNQRLVNVTTDALRTMPAGTANWSKPASGDFLYGWRQSASPAVYDAVVGADVRWNGLFQHLPADGEPPGVVYALSDTATPTPPAGAICSDLMAYDSWGRPQQPFTGRSAAAYGLALVRSDAADSVDSQPYRLDLVDIVKFRQGSGVTGQRFTPASSQSYIGIRLPIVPPFAAATLTVSVHRVSDGVQMGGSFTTTAGALGPQPYIGNGLRYLTGFLSSPASLVGGTQYEIRLASTSTGAGVDEWFVIAPDSSLAPTRGFGGTTDGAVIGGVHKPNQDLSINLIKQPDPPTNCVATIVDVPVTTSYLAAQVPTRESVSVSWTAPAVGMGALFRRYELDHSDDGGVTWNRIANINNAAVLSFGHREAARATASRYRVRAVGRDGWISTWATSGDVTPTTAGLVVILTSDHAPSDEVAYLYDRESSYLVLSTEGDEIVRVHGADRQVVFMEPETRGVGWQVNIWVNQTGLVGQGGEHVLTPLLRLIRPDPDTGELHVPYVCVMDNQGSRFLGHVSVSEVPQRQPAHRYTAQLTITPTTAVPVPVEVD